MVKVGRLLAVAIHEWTLAAHDEFRNGIHDYCKELWTVVKSET